MKTKAKNDFKAPDFNYEDKFYDLCEQNTSSFIKKAENKELSMGNTLSSVKNYYQYINCDSSVHQKEFESYSLEDKFDWMTEASEEFNKASFNKVKKILSSLDTNENVIEILNNFAIVGTDSYSELQILHKFVLKFEDIMQTFEMIISTNGKKSFLQFPSLIKDFINVYNALLCIISVSMIIYIRDLMEIHETCSVYDAYNTNLVITLQNIVKTLRPFTEKFTTPTGLIHKHIEKALKPINDDIKQNLVMFKREEKTLQEIKKQIPKLLDVNDLLSLSKALSLTTFIRTYYAYDKDALELMNEVDKQCISTSNFGFIPNLLVFIRDINPLFNQTPKTDFLISPTIFTQRKFLSSDTRYANITDDYTFNIEVLLRNAYVTHSYHKLCLHKYQEHDYSGVHITSHLPCSSSLDGFCRYDGWFDKRHYDKAYEFKFGNTNELKLKYYEKFISNSIKPLYYRALLVCTHSVCPKVIPSEYTCELILPLCKFNKLEYGRSHNYTNFLLSVRDVAYNCKKDLSEKNFIAFNYHLGIEDEYNKESKDVIDTFNTNVAKFDESSESDRLERVEKLLDTYVKPYGNSVLVHNGEKYECTRTDKGFNIKVNNTSNCFLTQSTIQYKPAKNGHYMVLSFNNGECFKEDDCYKWMYYGYDAMKNDIDFGFNFDDISKYQKELAIILSHAYKMDKITTKIDAEIEADQIKREIRQREIDAQFELDRMMRSMR
ncbi:DNA double-strand break repair Rad50 ATPase [Entamoeba marina]